MMNMLLQNTLSFYPLPSKADLFEDSPVAFAKSYNRILG